MVSTIIKNLPGKGGDDVDYQCNILSCEYNFEGECRYCGDIWRLNDEDYPTFVDKEE